MLREGYINEIHPKSPTSTYTYLIPQKGWAEIGATWTAFLHLHDWQHGHTRDQEVHSQHTDILLEAEARSHGSDTRPHGQRGLLDCSVTTSICACSAGPCQDGADAFPKASLQRLQVTK